MGCWRAACWQGNIASIGKREIAKQAHCAESLAVDSLKNLESAGHIAEVPDTSWAAWHIRTSITGFGKKQRAGYEDMVMDSRWKSEVGNGATRSEGTADTHAEKRNKQMKRATDEKPATCHRTRVRETLCTCRPEEAGRSGYEQSNVDPRDR